MVIAEHKATLFACMGMQIDINLNFATFNLLFDNFFHSPDRRLINRTRIYVIPIQVLGHRIKSIVAAIHSIGVQHWHYLEYEAVSEDFGLLTFFIRQELPYPSEYKGGGRLAWMHSRR